MRDCLKVEPILYFLSGVISIKLLLKYRIILSADPPGHLEMDSPIIIILLNYLIRSLRGRLYNYSRIPRFHRLLPEDETDEINLIEYPAFRTN